MKPVIIMIVFSIIVGGCITDKDDDLRPPLMDNNSFTNFVPIEIPTNQFSTGIVTNN